MAERAKTDGWSVLIDEAREALATLRADDLEAFAARAELMLDSVDPENLNQSGPHTSESSRQLPDLRAVAARHRLLGELLHETAGNLSVLERLRRSTVGSPWER